MQIIGGLYRRRRLKGPPSLRTRPTARRLRETLFNILAPAIEGARFLDLCAGSGAVGIEALSRGAAFVTFVDRSRKMCAIIEENLDLCRVPEEQSEVVLDEASDFLRRAARGAEGWDIIFFDPPYAVEYQPTLELFGAPGSTLLREDGVLIVEHYHKKLLPETLGQIRRWRLLKQGETCLSFYEHG
jgi:16S rRNA (guanine(966)-N(2))-methyltransferase RsmD